MIPVVRPDDSSKNVVNGMAERRETKSDPGDVVQQQRQIVVLVP